MTLIAFIERPFARARVLATGRRDVAGCSCTIISPIRCFRCVQH